MKQSLGKGSCLTSISRSVSGTSADEHTGFSWLHYKIQDLRAHEGELTARIQLLPKPPSLISLATATSMPRGIKHSTMACFRRDTVTGDDVGD